DVCGTRRQRGRVRGARAGGVVRLQRGEREVVDGHAVIGLGDVEVHPADEEGRPVRDVQAGDREADDGAVGGQVAVQGSDRAAGDRAREVEVVDVGVRPRRY